jgi:hypothetical protein
MICGNIAEVENRLRGQDQSAEETARAEKIALQESGGHEALGWTWRSQIIVFKYRVEP